MAADEKKPETPTLPGVLMMLAGLIFKREALLVVGVCVVLLAAGASGVVWAQGKLDGGVQPVRDELRTHVAAETKAREAVADDVAGLKADVAQIRRDAAAKEERDAARFELLYRTVLTRQPDSKADELAQPTPPALKDGGR